MTSISTLVDRVKIVVFSNGTGPFQLGPSVAAYRGVEALLDGATYSYATEFGANYEAGTGVYVAGSQTFVRSPLISSNGGAAVNFPANIELVFTALAQDLVATGATFPIVDSTGNDPAVAISQRAATVAVNGVAALLSGITDGTTTWDLPDEADGDAIPPPGSKLPYLSAGVLKIA